MYEGGVTSRASAISFNFFLAFFPAVIFLTTLIAYIPVDGFQENSINLIERLLPPELFYSVYDTIQDIIVIKRGGLLSFGALLTLIFSTNGINSIISGVTYTYYDLNERTIVNQYIISIILTLTFFMMIIICVGIVIFGEVLLHKISIISDTLASMSIYWGRILVIGVLIYLMVSTLFYFSIYTKRTENWRFFSPGSFLSTILVLFASYLFGFYVTDIQQYNKLYGSIGTLILILLWIYLNALAVLAGYELNVSIHVIKNQMAARWKFKQK